MSVQGIRALGSCSSFLRTMGIISRDTKKGLTIISDINNIVSNSLNISSIYIAEDNSHKQGILQTSSVCSDISHVTAIGKLGCHLTGFLSGHSIWKVDKSGCFVRKEGKFVVQHPLLIASTVSDVVSKVSQITCYGHQKQLWSLGSHSQGVGLAKNITSMLSSTFSAMHSIIKLGEACHQNKLTKSEDRVNVRQTVGSLLREVLDIAATPLESGIVNCGPICMTVGCGLSLLGSAVGLFNSIFND